MRREGGEPLDLMGGEDSLLSPLEQSGEKGGLQIYSVQTSLLTGAQTRSGPAWDGIRHGIANSSKGSAVLYFY